MENDVIKTRLENGVTVYAAPRKGYLEKQAMVAVNYGSGDNAFCVGGEKCEFPLGIAHFLEHKLFEDKNINVFDEFSKLGASTNAFTNFNTTAYYFNTVDNFEECLDILLEFVSSLYLTEENVKKEKGIITQEIMMYEDDPMWQVYFNMLSALYTKNPVKNNIAGDVGSVEGISIEMLEKCYNSFYTMDNVAVVVCGDVENENVIERINKKLKLNCGGEVNRCTESEPIEIAKTTIQKKMAVERAIFNIGFKENQFDLDIAQRVCTSKLALDIMFGTSSRFYEGLYAKGLIDESFSYDYLSGRDFGVSILSGVSNDIESVKGAIVDEIEKFKVGGFHIEDIERMKKKHIGRLKRAEQSVSGMCAMLADNFCKGIEMVDFYEKYDNIDREDLFERVSVHLDEGNMAISIIEPI